MDKWMYGNTETRMIITGEALFNQSRDLLEKCDRKKREGKLEDFDKDLRIAEEGFNKLLTETIHKDGAVAHILFYLACINMKRQAYAMAIVIFREAIRHKEDFIEATSNLGYVYKEVGLFDNARKSFERVWHLVKKNPDKVPPKDKSDYLTNIGSLLIQNGTPQQALDFFNEALTLKGCGDTTKWNKSLSLLELGHYKEGFAMYDYGSRTERCKNRKYGIADLKDWDGTKGQTVVIYGEQGLGDEIMFASMIADMEKDCNVIVDCHPRLMDLFRSNYPHLAVYGTRKTEEQNIAWRGLHKIDAKLAMGSMCQFYRNKEDDFPRLPYFEADPEKVEKWAKRLAELPDRPNIGFSWKGGVRATGVNQRHIPLELWLELFKLPVNWISLQYNKDIDEEVAVFEKLHDVKLNHWPDMLADYDETAGVLANLDLVISTPQSVVHLAGAMGVPTWQLPPFRSMWQCGVFGKEMPWYGTVHNIWQEKHGEWKPVLDKVQTDLEGLLESADKASGDEEIIESVAR